MNAAALIALATVLGTAAVAAPASLDYLRDVKPLLTEHCCRCHGASQQKGGLRLDTAKFMHQGGQRGAAILPGKSAESLLIRVVEGTHEEIERMPYKKTPLAPTRIDLLKRWIDAGADAPPDEQPELAGHWAFNPPIRPAVPSPGKYRARVANPIDAFILARLEKQGIAPSPQADRVTLIRRLSLDLIGLPPSIQEVDEFLHDKSPEAYERLVDRLLASPHYGERWGRWWLDAARYADSNGYSIDAPRSIWKYRDWVVDALNRDLPFDQFTIEQLAGDLLPNATVDQKTATGFHRNTQINQEGGIDPEQFRVESVIDRVNTTATVFLGITLGCAQCHDHKFDPFTQLEYYEMFAFFNSQIEDGHGKGTPDGMLEIPGEFEPLQNRDKAISELEEDLDRYLNTQGSAQQQWEQSLGVNQIAELRPDAREALQVAFASRTPGQKRATYAAFRPEDPEFKQRNARLAKLLQRQPKPVTTLVMEELPEPRETHVFIKGDFTRPGDPVTPGVPAVLPPLYSDVDLAGKPRTANRPHPHPLPQEREPPSAPVGNQNTQRSRTLSDTPGLRTTHLAALHESAIGAPSAEGQTAGSTRRASETLADDRTLLPLPANKVLAGLSVGAPPAEGQTAGSTRRASETLADDRTPLPLPGGEGRGEGASTEHSTPVVNSRLPNRLDLARWIVASNNPLTARVLVNRVWQQYFGHGIVETENDFGTQGIPPSHPELLDWLAVELMEPGMAQAGERSEEKGERGFPSARSRTPSSELRTPNPSLPTPGSSLLSPPPWSLKHLHRLIVTSATYRQSSNARRDLRDVDPNNRLLARQNRLRLDAEVVRDVALAASGLLSPEIGGPPVFPPQPDGVMTLGQIKRAWNPSIGHDRYRRGLYTHFWRATPHPALAVFDAPDGFSACTRRLRSNTPLQALTLLNDEAYHEFAQALARRLMREGGRTATTRIDFAVRLCVSRPPSRAERKRLLDLLREERAASDESTAWTTVSRVLLNLDETVTRE